MGLRTMRECIAVMRLDEQLNLVHEAYFFLPDEYFDSLALAIGWEGLTIVHCDPSPAFSPLDYIFRQGSDRIMKIEWSTLSETHVPEEIEINVQISTLLAWSAEPLPSHVRCSSHCLTV